MSFQGGDKMTNFLTLMARSLGQKCVVKVGFLEGSMAGWSGPRPISRGGKRGSKAKGGQSPAPQVAAALEYGVPEKNIPPRPFFSGMVSKQSPTWGRLIAVALRHHSYSAAEALKETGLRVSEQLQQSIQEFTSPSDSEKTIARKGGIDSPLKDSLNMMNSVDYIVLPEESGE